MVLRARVQAGAAEEFSSPELTFCADSCSVSVLPCVTAMAHSKDSGHSAKSAGRRLHLHTVGWLCSPSRHSVGTYQGNEPTQLITEHLAIIVSARWVIVNWFWPKKWNWCVWADLHFKKIKEKKKAQAGNESLNLPHSPHKQGEKSCQPNIKTVLWCESTVYWIPVDRTHDASLLVVPFSMTPKTHRLNSVGVISCVVQVEVGYFGWGDPRGIRQLWGVVDHQRPLTLKTCHPPCVWVHQWHQELEQL